MKKQLLLLALFALIIVAAQAQNVNGLLFDATNTATRDASAAFEINANTNTIGSPLYGGLLIPRVTLTGTTDVATIAGTEANGLMVFNTATAGDVTPGVYYWSTASNTWIRLITPGNLPTSLKWNALTDPDGNLSLAHGTNTTTFNWATGTGANDLFSLTSDVSSNGTGSLLNVQTGTGATLIPFRVRVGATEAIYVTAAGNVGIGTATTNRKFMVQGDARISTRLGVGGDISGNYGLNLVRSNTSENVGGGIQSAATVASAVLTANRAHQGINNTITNAVTAANIGANTLTVYGVNSLLTQTAASTSITNAYGMQNRILQNIATGTITNAYGAYNQVYNQAGTISTNAWANYNHVSSNGNTTADARGTYNLMQTTGTGTFTNAYGTYTEFSGTMGTKWGTYVTGENKNYFSGNVGIGSLTPSQMLDVTGDINTSSGYRIGNAASNGTFLRGDGTRYVASTLTLPNAAAVNTILYASSANTIAALATANNSVLTTDGTGVPSWTNSASLGVKWNALTAPDGNLSLAHANYTTAFTFNGLTGANANAFSLSSASTAGTASSASTVLNIGRSGANANASHTAYGIQSAVTNSGATSTNIAGYFSASGATNNYALIVPSTGGRVGIGTLTPTMVLDVTSATTTAGESAIRGASTGNAAVYGVQGSVTATTTNAAGVYGTATGNARVFGVFGSLPATVTTADAAGVRGYTAGGAGSVYGVFGENTATGASSAGVRGLTSSNGTMGVLGQNTSTGTGSQYGVYGQKSGATGTGTGYGVYGIASGTATTNYGVYGTSTAGTTSIGGYFTATGGTSNYGIIVPSGGGSVGIATSTPFATLTNGGSTAFGTLALGNFATGGAIGTAAATVDIYTAININQTTAGQTVTLPNPTTTTAGRILKIANVGSAAFTVGGVAVGAAQSTDFFWNGTAWVAEVGASSPSLTVPISGLLPAIAANTIDNTNYAQTWNWSTATTQTPITITSNGLTSGTALAVSSTSTGLLAAGNIATVALTGNNAANAGTVLKVSNTGAANTGTAMMVTNLGAGNSFRVNDETGDADATPFIISSNGNVGVGSATPAAKLDVTGDVYVKGATGINHHSGSYTTSAGGIKELFRVASLGLCTGGTFTISGTRGSFVHISQWAWSSTHNSTGRGVLTQLSSGEYSNIPVYLDVSNNGDVIISANWGAAQTYNISIEKTSGGAINVASVYTDWTTVNAGYTRVRSVTTISNGLQTQDAVFNGFVGVGAGVSGTYRLNVGGKLKTDGIDENSDIRLKKDINPIDEALQKVNRMRGVTYNWRKDEFPERNMETGLQYGLIAQELEAIIPELVTTDDKGFKAIEYSHLVPVLIEAIKELDAKNNTQKAELDKQTKTNEELKASIESLMIRMNAVENSVEVKTNKAEK